MSGTIKVELSNDDGKEVVEFNAVDVLAHNGEMRSWDELASDSADPHLQMSLAEDYALFHFKRRHGDQGGYHTHVIEGLTDGDDGLAPNADCPTVLVEKMQAAVDSGSITNAKQADEAVCKFLGESNLNISSSAYEALCATLCDIAGNAFPGGWDDYPLAAPQAM